MTPSMTRSLCPLAVFVAGFALLVATQVAIRQEARRRPDHGAALGVGALKLEPLSGRAAADSGPGQPAARHSPHAVNCSEWAVVPPVRAAFMQSRGPRYMISFSWWDDRGGLKRASGAEKALGEMAVAPANEEVHHVQRLVLQSAAGAALVDVGANVGFMTFFAAATDRPVFAFDPIGYNVAKLCEGLMVNRAASTLSRVQGDLVHIFHAAVGRRHQGSINVTRPADSVGFFDQSSLTATAVQMPESHKVAETIDMVTLDDMIPSHVPVGVVKIDVQGHEEGVLRGMSRILARKTGYPTAIVFEEMPEITRAAGWTPGNSELLLRDAGYACGPLYARSIEVLCTKS